MRPDLLVGLDVGSSRVRVVAAEMNDRGIQIIGVGEAASTGLRKGMIINMEATVDSMKQAVRNAELAAGIRIKSVIAGVSGPHIKGLSSNGVVGIRRKEVRVADTERAIESAKAVHIPLDREILHVIPSDFVLDGQEGIVDPVGMAGVRLEAKVHIITGFAASVQNMMKCCERAGLDVADLVFSPIASAGAALSREEKDCGVILADIGAGTSDLVFYKDGALRHSSVLGVGGAHVTNDIAVGLRISFSDAEKLKREYGSAYAGMENDPAAEVQICQTSGDTRTIPAKYITEIMQPRCEEMIHMLRDEIRACFGYELATCGVVCTGGAALMRGFVKTAESLLGLPVRLGQPATVTGNIAAVKDPAYSTGVGLLIYASGSLQDRAVYHDVLHATVDGIRGWLKGIFGSRDHISFNNRKEGGMACLKLKK